VQQVLTQPQHAYTRTLVASSLADLSQALSP